MTNSDLIMQQAKEAVESQRSDLVERLRENAVDLLKAGNIDPGLPDDGELMIEAADRIEELEARPVTLNGEWYNQNYIDNQQAHISHLESRLKRLGSGKLFKPDNVLWLDWIAEGGEIIAHIKYAKESVK